MFMQVVVIGAILTPGFFSIFQYHPIANTVSPVRAELRFEFTVRGAQESSQPQSVFAQPIAYRDAQFVCIQLFENKCVNLYLHLSILRGCVDTQWSCVQLRLACGLFAVFIPPKKSRRPGLKQGDVERIRVGLTVYTDSMWLGGVSVLSPVGDHILQQFNTLYLT